MNPSDQDRNSHPSSLKFGNISFDKVPKEMPFPPSRMKLPEEDPFSLKVIERLEREGLFIRWRFGYRLANRYEVRRIHSGGMGIVWIVEDLFDNRKPYAAKSVKPFFKKPETDEEWEKREKSIQRFLEECKIWVDLEKHRHIVYAEFLEKIEGVPLVMSEYIEGGDLSEWIKKGPMPIATLLEFAIQFCIGMEYANSRGVLVHRDIKPGNLMVAGDTLKINDFGLSRAIESAEDIGRGEKVESEPTFDIGEISISRGMGTPLYMATEQFSKKLLDHAGYPIHAIAIPTDVFAFGLVIYELIKGKHPYLEKWDQRIWDRALKIASELSISRNYAYCFLKSINLNLSPPISDNNALDNLILKCLKKDPAERYQSFTELKEELTEIYYQVAGRRCEIFEDIQPKPNFKNKGKTAFILGREEEAIKFYDKALEENPGNTDVWLEKGLVMAEMGKLGESRTCMEIIPYLKPTTAAKSFIYLDEIIRIMHPMERQYLLRKRRSYDDISSKDIRMLDKIDASPISIRKARQFLVNSIKGRDKEIFRDTNPFLEKLRAALSRRIANTSVLDNGKEELNLLKRISDVANVPALIDALKHGSRSLQKEAALTLGELGDPVAIPFLSDVLQDRLDREIRMARVMGEESMVTDLCVFISLALRKLGDTSAVLYLKGKGEPSHFHILFSLFLMGDISSARHFISILLYSNSFVSPEEYQTDPTEFEEGFLEKFYHCLSDRDITEAVKNAVDNYGGVSAFPVLLSALKDQNMDIRWLAVEILGMFGHTSGIQYLIEILKQEKDQRVRGSCISALGKIDDASVCSYLIEGLKDKAPEVRTCAVRALNRFMDETSIKSLRNFCKNSEVFPYLVEMLRDHKFNYLREEIRVLLGQLGDASLIPCLANGLIDKDEEIRINHALVLAWLGDMAAVPYLINIVKSKLGERNKRSAMILLRKLLGNSVMSYVVDSLKDEEAVMRITSIELLGTLSDVSVVPYLINALEDKDKTVRDFVVWALGNFNDKSIILELIQTIPSSRYPLDVVRALRSICSKTEEVKLSNLKMKVKKYSAFEWNKKGNENLESGNKEEAIKCFEKAVEIDPDWKEPKENLKKCKI